MSVTVAITTHAGHKGKLSRAIESALGADEVIVIDNGWSCMDIAERYGVKYLGRDETMLVDSRNLAIEYASCDWLIQLDADDQLLYVPCDMTGDWAIPAVLILIDVHGSITGAWDYRMLPRTWDRAIDFLREHFSLPVPMKAAHRVAWLKDNDLKWRDWPNVRYAEDVRTCLDWLRTNPQITVTAPFYGYTYRSELSPDEVEMKNIYISDLSHFLDTL